MCVCAVVLVAGAVWVHTCCLAADIDVPNDQPALEHVNIHTHVHVNIRTHMHVNLRTHVLVNIRTHMHVNLRTHVHVNIRTHVHVNIRTHMHVNLRTHVLVNIHTHNVPWRPSHRGSLTHLLSATGSLKKRSCVQRRHSISPATNQLKFVYTHVNTHIVSHPRMKT